LPRGFSARGEPAIDRAPERGLNGRAIPLDLAPEAHLKIVHIAGRTVIDLVGIEEICISIETAAGLVVREDVVEDSCRMTCASSRASFPLSLQAPFEDALPGPRWLMVAKKCIFQIIFLIQAIDFAHFIHHY
jgi:hypothetical protein